MSLVSTTIEQVKKILSQMYIRKPELGPNPYNLPVEVNEFAKRIASATRYSYSDISCIFWSMVQKQTINQLDIAQLAQFMSREDIDELIGLLGKQIKRV